VKRLYRSRQYRVLGGVAAGAADYLGVDITVMRLLFALVGVVVPQVIIAYILAWVIIPEAPIGTYGPPPVNPAETTNANGAVFNAEWHETPEAGKTAASPENLPPAEVQGNRDRGRQLFGFLLIGVGAVALFRNVFPHYIWRMPINLVRQWWPVGIIALGLALVFGALRGR
jgi:phage shock protein C